MWMIAELNLCQQLNQCQWGRRCFRLFWLAFTKSGLLIFTVNVEILRFQITSHTQWLWLHLQRGEEKKKCNLLQRGCNEWSGESCEPVVSLTHNKINVTVSGNYKCKSIAVTCGLTLRLDLAVAVLCLYFILLIRLIQPLLITLVLGEAQVGRRAKEAEMLKCVSIWRTNGWSACYQQSGVVCAGRWLLQKQGNLEDRCCAGRNSDILSRSLMFNLVISNLLGICLPVHIRPQRARILPTLK